MSEVIVEQPAPKVSSPIKPILIVFGILALVGISAYAGYRYGKVGTAVPVEGVPPQSKESTDFSEVKWKTFSDDDLKFSFGYISQDPSPPIEANSASWGRYIDYSIPTLSLPGVSYRIKVYPSNRGVGEVYGKEVDYGSVWEDAVKRMRNLTPGVAEDPIVACASEFPFPCTSSSESEIKIVSSRFGALGVESFGIDVPSGTLAHMVVFIVDPEISYKFAVSYTLQDSAKWKELRESILNGTADEQFLLADQNFLQIVSTFQHMQPAASASEWKSYQNTLYKFSLKYPPNLELSERVSEDPVVGGPQITAEFRDLAGAPSWPDVLVEVWSDGDVTLFKAKTVGHITSEITKEYDVLASDVTGKRLDFILTERGKQWSGAVFNRGNFSYWIYAEPSLMDKILSTLKFS